MAKPRKLVGLDVHAAGVAAAVLDVETGELGAFSLPGDVVEVTEFCSVLPRPVRATYEAGPTGYALARELERRGVGCLVCAPGKIPRAPGDRVKTDRRDAEHLVRLLLAGKLHAVRVPGPAEEGLRDLVRAREDVRVDLMRARHRLSKLLLRHGLRFEARAWTARHAQWLAQVELAEPTAQATLLDYRGAVDGLVHRRDGLDRAITQSVATSDWAPQAGRLRCLRGIDVLSAAGLCCEVGDFARFERAGQLASFVGLVPSEDSTGERKRRGAITKTGSRHARRLLVEAAWHYRKPPRTGPVLEARQSGQPAAAVAISWSAQQRLHRTWRRLEQRGKPRNIVAVAVARELAGFCWSIARTE